MSFALFSFLLKSKSKEENAFKKIVKKKKKRHFLDFPMIMDRMSHSPTFILVKKLSIYIYIYNTKGVKKKSIIEKTD